MYELNDETAADYDVTPPPITPQPTAFSPADQSVLDAAARILSAAIRTTDALTEPYNVKQYLICELRGYERECFACLFLDNRHRPIAFEKLFFGTIDGATVHPREVVKRALARNAAAVIFAHNHPSGVAEPSHADRAMTERLSNALALVDVRVLDHIVIGDGPAVSLAERGLM